MEDLYFILSYDFEDYIKSDVEFDDPSDFVREVKFNIYAEDETSSE